MYLDTHGSLRPLRIHEHLVNTPHEGSALTSMARACQPSNKYEVIAFRPTQRQIAREWHSPASHTHTIAIAWVDRILTPQGS